MSLERSDRLPALRHVVYRDLLSMLPPASIGQTVVFMANLALCRNRYRLSDSAAVRDKAVDEIMQRLLWLKVTPDAQTVSVKWPQTRGSIEQALGTKYGDRLANVAGFHKTDRWRLNLPENCAMHGYKGRTGFYTGILCQPLNSINTYFLLSSSKFGGPKAVRMEDEDQDFFDRFKDPIDIPAARPLDISSASLEGWKVRGRGRNVRLVEPSNGNK